MKRELIAILSKFYKNINFKVIPTNNFEIESFFRFKDRIPKSMQSSLVYKFSCVQNGTSVSSYIGSTKRHLYERIAEHANRSPRTGKLTAHHSNIYNHSVTCHCEISERRFEILGYCKNEFNLRLLESLYIHKFRPNLNDQLTASPLLVVN